MSWQETQLCLSKTGKAPPVHQVPYAIFIRMCVSRKHCNSLSGDRGGAVRTSRLHGGVLLGFLDDKNPNFTIETIGRF